MDPDHGEFDRILADLTARTRRDMEDVLAYLAANAPDVDQLLRDLEAHTRRMLDDMM